MGIGNIAGVATAIYYGGPGALLDVGYSIFWNHFEICRVYPFSAKYREMDALGKTAGGPMYTIENGLGLNGAG